MPSSSPKANAPVTASRGADTGSTGEHLAVAASRRESMTSNRARVRWYLSAALAAVGGAALVLVAFHEWGALFPFLAGFTMLLLVAGGFGPLLLAGWGAATLALLDAEYAQAILLGPNAVRLAVFYLLALVFAFFGGRLRRSRLTTLERESRLSSALERVQDLYSTTQEFHVQQRAERDLLEGILATSIAGVIVVDIAGSIIFANARAEEVLGLRVSEIEGRRFDAPEWRHTSLDGGDFPDDQQPFAQVLRSAEPVFEVRHGIEWPDGRRKLLSINGAPLFDEQGKIEAVVFGVTDITDIIAAERELRARDQRLDQITSVMPGIVYQYARDAAGRESFPFMSSFAGQLIGADVEEMMASPAIAWSRVHPDDQAGMLESTERSQRDLTPWSYEFRVIDRNQEGSWRWLSGQAIPQRDAGGGTVWNGVFVDVTDRRRLEDELRQVQRIESVGLLAGGIAHDFNNVLTAIIGEASLLEDDAEPGGDVAVSAGQIRAAAESGAALSRQLLGFARRHVLAPRTVEVTAIIDRAVPFICWLLRERITLELDVAGNAGRVRVDPALFDQVLMNLAVNASDAMPDGGVLSIRCGWRAAADAETLAMPNAPVGAVVVFEITDTGSGMTEETRLRALEPFFTTKEAGKGSGLGLATSYGIVTQAGGTMSISSAPGVGTVVRIVLPATEGMPEPAAVPEKAAADGKETLMVVDDDEPVRRVTAATLRRRGYHVLEAPGGLEALRIGRELGRPVDLLVTDVVMPGMTGVMLAREFLAEGLTSRVLFLSGYPEGTITQHGVVPDGVELLTKPFDIQELSRRVRRLLDQPVSG